MLQHLVYEGVQGTTLSWVPNNRQSGIPQGAVIGGHGEDGYPVFVAWTKKRFGWYDPRETLAEYGAYGENYSSRSSHWEFLVITYSAYIFFLEKVILGSRIINIDLIDRVSQ